MKKVWMLFVLCSLTLICCVSPAEAAGTTPTTKMVVGEVAADNTVDVEIYLENNPGIITMILEVGYDKDVMTLLKVQDAGILGTAMHTDNLALNPYQLTWNNATAVSDYRANGKLVTLTFKVNDQAVEGKYPISLNCHSTMNYDMDDVTFAAEGGMLVVEKVSYNPANGNVAVRALPKGTSAVYAVAYADGQMLCCEMRTGVGVLTLSEAGNADMVRVIYLGNGRQPVSAADTVFSLGLN